LVKGIYNLFFHPLAKLPGPRYAAFSQLYFSYVTLSRRYPFIIKELHDKYGPVVRVSPNQVSFDSASSWKDIYGHVGGRKPFLKSDLYDSDARPKSIVTIRDPVEHGAMRKLLSNAFSAKALAGQESIVHIYVDLLVKQIGKHATGKPEGEGMVKWYNWCTFDIIGDLAFGDPFGCLEAGVPHFWVSAILDSIKVGAYNAMLIKYIGNSKPALALKKLFVPKHLMAQRERHFGYGRDKMMKRMNNPNSTRKDFMSNILSEKESREISVGALTVHGSLLIVAGSETTAAFLSATTYYLCRTPHAYKKLVDEIRSKFATYEDITNQNTEKCTYLKAVIDEGLRSYPPLPFGLGRDSPGETVDGIFIPEGTEVFTSPWASTHSEANFHRPYEFLPERWIDKDCTDKKEASRPFLLGTRVCLGRNLAYLEMRVILAKMLWVYDMELKNEKLDWIAESDCHVFWKKPELRVNFTRRDGICVPPLDDDAPPVVA
ncbi:putative cytochrome P450, partial [Wilcoxina mikolae CBS 423.85]